MNSYYACSSLRKTLQLPKPLSVCVVVVVVVVVVVSTGIITDHAKLPAAAPESRARLQAFLLGSHSEK